MIDRLIIKVKSGDGGKGSVSFNRDSKNSRGGPDGGSGGKGGNIILKANSNLSDLNKYSFQKKFIAENGTDGSKQKKSGSNGKDLILDLPVGCLVWEIDGDKRNLVASMVNETSEINLYDGGTGGKGNTSFVSSQNKEPLLAESGQTSQVYSLELDFRIYSDILLLGPPNVGKSTFLSSVSNARPEIKNYPYTTREPIIAIAKINYKNIKIVELPSIDNGKGLGIDYTKHLYAAKLICLTFEYNDSLETQISNLTNYISSSHSSLMSKNFIILITKSDTISNVEKNKIKNIVFDKFPFIKVSPFYFSSKNSKDSADIFSHIENNLNQDKYLQNDRFTPIITLRNTNIKKIQITDNIYEILDKNFIQLAEGSDLSNWKALVQFQYKLKTSKISKDLTDLGIKKGDKLRISNYEFTWEE